jgi:hypothetical protein
LDADAALAALVGDRIFQASDLQEAPATKPFVVLRFLPTVPEVADARSHSLQAWAHDVPGSYVRIDDVLRKIRASLTSAANAGDFLEAIWNEDGPDLVDDVFRTVTRYSRYRIVAAR